MDSEKVIKRDNEYVLHTYARNPIVLEKGHGLYAEGPEGQKYLDFTSGIGVNSLGYCDMTWAEAVSEQAHKLQHTSNLYYTAPCGKLAKKLCKRTGMSKVFFGNSGAEANEGAIKAARKYSFDKYGADRYNVITLVNSFHGRTIATLTATGQGVFHNYFGPFNEGFQYVKAGDIIEVTFGNRPIKVKVLSDVEPRTKDVAREMYEIIEQDNVLAAAHDAPKAE
jgi:acetylornithine/N-succinyldiaminopimelate aminotransferase